MIIGYILASTAGFSLGLLGAGGSVLTIPIIVYFFGFSPKIAVPLSLAIVGGTTLFALTGHLRQKTIQFKAAFILGIFTIPGTFAGAYFSQFFSNHAQMILFALIMILASISMFIKKSESKNQSKAKNYLPLGVSGVIIGLLTGVIGVGGGFLIVPALLHFAHLDIKKSISTSLFLVTLNSLLGFISYINIVTIPWSFLFKFLFFSIIGIIIGSMVAKKTSPAKLKKYFGLFLIIIGVFILIENFI